MGEDVDWFSREGSAKPALVAKLNSIGVQNPELLARLIDGYAGFDIDAGLFGLGAERRKVRAVLRPLIIALQEEAAALLQAGSIAQAAGSAREVDVLSVALIDIIYGSKPNAVHRADEYWRSIELIAAAPIREQPRGASTKDESVNRVVLAVADYCGRAGIPFSGEPRRAQTIDGPTYPVKSPAARLVRDTLGVLGLNVPPEDLATHMKKARSALAAVDAQLANK